MRQKEPLSPDVEIEKRMRDGFFSKFGRSMEDSEFVNFMRLAFRANCDPLIHTYREVDEAVIAWMQSRVSPNKFLSIL